MCFIRIYIVNKVFCSHGSFFTMGGLDEMTRVFLNLASGFRFKSKPWEYSNFKSYVIELCLCMWRYSGLDKNKHVSDVIVLLN